MTVESKSAQPAGKPETFKAERVLAPDRPVFYSNSVFVIANQWDVQLNFGFTTEMEPGKFANVEKVVVILTPEHAVKLVDALKRTTDAYQASNGPIRDIKIVEMPPSQ